MIHVMTHDIMVSKFGENVVNNEASLETSLLNLNGHVHLTSLRNAIKCINDEYE